MITIDPGSAPDKVDGVAPIMVTDNGFGGTDRLISIEKIKLGGQDDTVTVGPTFADALKTLQEVDGGGGRNTLDLTQISKDLTFENNKIKGYNTEFKNFNVLKADPGDDTVILKGQDAQSWQEVDFGNGNDTVDSDVTNLVINFGNGKDLLKQAGRGTIVNAGQGLDTFHLSNDILIVGAKPTDQIVDANGNALHGAVGQIGSESPWIVGSDDMSYGVNAQGQLAIKDNQGNITYIAKYQGGPNVPFSQQTAGIYVGLASFSVSMLVDLKRPYNENIPTTFKLGNQLYFTETGKTIFNQSYDPLVFDLTGGGINLTGVSTAAPLFDANRTGFGVHTGWFEQNDGILVIDKNGNGQIDDISEVVGGQGGGFAALAQYDTNGDGVIDANDPIYAQLQIWRDTNVDGKVDPGELMTLAQANCSCSFGSTSQLDRLHF
jgi:hypothetical protein